MFNCSLLFKTCLNVYSPTSPAQWRPAPPSHTQRRLAVQPVPTSAYQCPLVPTSAHQCRAVPSSAEQCRAVPTNTIGQYSSKQVSTQCKYANFCKSFFGAQLFYKKSKGRAKLSQTFKQMLKELPRIYLLKLDCHPCFSRKMLPFVPMAARYFICQYNQLHQLPNKKSQIFLTFNI